MLTWKVALVLLIFALILTELSPHSSFLFGIASEIEMIDAWACMFLFFFYMAYLQFSVLQVSILEGFLLLFLFFFPSLTKITGLWVPETKYQFWCRPLEWENPLLALMVTPALQLWAEDIPPSLYAGSFWSLPSETANCPELNAVHFNMSYCLLMTEQNQCIHLSKEFKQGSRNGAPCALVTKLFSSVHSLNMQKKEPYIFKQL